MAEDKAVDILTVWIQIASYACFLIQISDINRLRSILYADKAKESEAELCIAPCCR